MIALDLFWIFFRMSLVAFGGIFGLLPELQRIIVVDRGWMTAQEFVQSYAVGQLVPGPNMAMCTLIGYRVDGIPGAIAGFLGIYTTPLFFMAAAAAVFVRYGQIAWVRRLEISLRPLVFGLIVASALSLFGQQARGDVVAALLLGAACFGLYARRKAGALTLIFVGAAVWWLYAEGIREAVGWLRTGFGL